MGNNYNLSDKQYEIIRHALEKHYYDCRGDSELVVNCDSIIELEKSLIKQKEVHEKEHKEMLDKIHVCYCDVMDEKPTDEQVAEIAPKIKEELKYEADQWGWDDTEIGDRIWNWINENIKYG